MRSLKIAEQKLVDKLATKTLRQQYRVKAHNIGSNAIRLVNDFFKGGISDMIERPIGRGWVKCTHCDWTLTDLDRALDEMRAAK